MGLGFRTRLEEVHDYFHLWFGGHLPYMVGNLDASKVFEDLGIIDVFSYDGAMNLVPIAAFDPVFYFHHAYVDYIYAEWQASVL
jgi:hypothetical protein